MTNNLIVKSKPSSRSRLWINNQWTAFNFAWYFKIPKEQDINPYFGYEITAQEFATAYNIHPKTAYRELREASNKLYERSIIIRNEQQTMKLRWASSIIADNPYPTDVFPDEHWKEL